MARFYVPRPRIESGLLKVEGEEVRHIRKVLRLGTGDEVVVFDGSAMEYLGTIVEEGPSTVVIEIKETLPSIRESVLEVTLAQSLLKGEKMDYLVQKATEIGVKEILPFFSSRSVPLLDRSKELARLRRWEKIAIGAAKQCGRGVIPKIGAFQEYAEMIERVPHDSLLLVLWEKDGTRLKEALKKYKERERIFFIVGPEGGLSEQEVEEAKANGFIPVTLGTRILRSETAALCVLSILQYEWGDIG